MIIYLEIFICSSRTFYKNKFNYQTRSFVLFTWNIVYNRICILNRSRNTRSKSNSSGSGKEEENGLKEETKRERKKIVNKFINLYELHISNMNVIIMTLSFDPCNCDATELWKLFSPSSSMVEVTKQICTDFSIQRFCPTLFSSGISANGGSHFLTWPTI